MFPTLIVEPALCFTVSLWALAARGILHSTCKLRNFIHMEKSTDTKVAVCKFLDFIPRYVP